ncbi:hypothetical protein [Deinococcus sp. JMULE3]|uniref:hypothetical protein n=1 Tax=Deinococcus sp. JMULE3 TaxID=2518341 RepID=UPI0015764968|nr:hypothetical protein [Deinococcus sp. JMULE3]NTY00377.1 hypothetical protein [Deinococcus sp. JMULE3]
MPRPTLLLTLAALTLGAAHAVRVPDFLNRVDRITTRPFCQTFGCHAQPVTVGPDATYRSVTLTTYRYEIQKIFGQLTIRRMQDGYVYDMHLTAAAYPLTDVQARAFSLLTRDLLDVTFSRAQLNTCLNEARQDDQGGFLTLVDQWAVGCSLIPQDGSFKSVITIWPIG